VGVRIPPSAFIQIKYTKDLRLFTYKKYRHQTVTRMELELVG
jgi:hypothetical protein